MNTIATAEETTSAPFGWTRAAPAASGRGTTATSCGRLAAAATAIAAPTVTASTTTQRNCQPGSNGIGACRRPPDRIASVTRLGKFALPPVAEGATRTAAIAAETGTTRHWMSE